MFTAGVMRDLAKKGRSLVLARLIASLPHNPAGSLADFFNHAYVTLCHIHGRNEYVYKNVLTDKILLGEHSPRTAAVVPELRVGAVKADFTIFNGTSTVYEIKTDRDNLKRLQNQIAHYRLFFDKIHVIAGESHVENLHSELPDIVGIVRVSPRMQRTTVRRATSNWKNIDPTLVFESLRVDEINVILAMNGMAIPVVPNTIMRKAQYELFKTLSVSQIHQGAVSAIHSFRGQQSLAGYLDALPHSLKGMGVSIKLSARERLSFLNCLNLNVSEALAWG